MELTLQCQCLYGVGTKKNHKYKAQKDPHWRETAYMLFKEIGNLKKHERTNTGEKQFACSKCEKAFNQSGPNSKALKGHERTHTGEKPFACSKCEKSFTERGKLKRHERIHTGENPFACSMCDKSFA